MQKFSCVPQNQQAHYGWTLTKLWRKVAKRRWAGTKRVTYRGGTVDTEFLLKLSKVVSTLNDPEGQACHSVKEATRGVHCRSF